MGLILPKSSIALYCIVVSQGLSGLSSLAVSLRRAAALVSLIMGDATAALSGSTPPPLFYLSRPPRLIGFVLLGSSEQGASFPGSRLRRRPPLSQELYSPRPSPNSHILVHYCFIHWTFRPPSQRAYPQSLLRRSTRTTRAPPPYGMPISAQRSTSPHARAAPTYAPSSLTSSASPSIPRTTTVVMFLLFYLLQIIHSS
jgi:hypothetical protein